MLNKHNKIQEKKIYLNKKLKIQNKTYEFYITQIGENASHFYIFTPFIILMLFGEKNKKFQKINLNLKDCKNLIKFGKIWGLINTLFKCMCINKSKNKIFFKFNSLEDEKNELYKIAIDENSKHFVKTININSNTNNNYLKKISSKSSMLKDKDNFQTKYKDNMFEINLLNCTLLKINITLNKSENKYYKIPDDVLKTIFNIKDENKIFNSSCTDISIMAHCIGENSKLIISALEADVISEEQALIKKAKKKDELYNYENINNESQNSRHQDSYKRIRTFQLFQNNSHLLKKETKKEESDAKKSLNINNYGIDLVKTYTKKVSISNIDSLNKIRMEHGAMRINKKNKRNKK
jgi:hypothetical protein